VDVSSDVKTERVADSVPSSAEKSDNEEGSRISMIGPKVKEKEL